MVSGVLSVGCICRGTCCALWLWCGLLVWFCVFCFMLVLFVIACGLSVVVIGFELIVLISSFLYFDFII